MSITVTAAVKATIPAANERPAGFEITDVDGNVWNWAPCQRCGGTGHYSFNLLDGDKCYGCHRRCGEWVEAKVWKRRQADKARRARKAVAAAEARAVEREARIAEARAKDELDAYAEIEAQEARLAAKAARAPYPSGVATVEATVISIQQRENPHAYRAITLKLLAEMADGYRVWMTLPAALSGVEKGDRFKFTASFEVSKNDPEFGFASRPRKVRLLASA